jgi:hypothetical protein
VKKEISKNGEKQIIYYDRGFVEDEYDNYHKQRFKKYFPWVLIIIGAAVTGYTIYRKCKN